MFGSPGSFHGASCVSPTAVFAEEIIATGPPGARFKIGISSFAQPELNVPSTPSTDLSFAYARAFAVHFSVAQPPC